MNIEILHLVEGAQKATGLTVIIDVFRAFSVAAYAFDRGAGMIIPVGDIDHAYRLKKENPEYLLIGERKEQMLPGFDFGNSPLQVIQAKLKGKTVVHTTSAGTQGIVNAVNADEILTGSFVNADAIIKYIKRKQPDNVSLVCMGYSAKKPIEEDTLCAEYIKNSLTGKPSDYDAMVETIRNTSGKRFFDPEKATYNPPEDFHLCLNLNRFDFVMRAVKDKEGLFYLKKIYLS